MELNLKIKKAKVLITDGTDIINLYLDADTAFPEMKYEPVMKMEARKGYGVEYCREKLGFEPEIIDVSGTLRK